MNLHDKIRAMLNTNGRTTEEAQTFRAKALEMIAKNGLTLEQFEPKVQPKAAGRQTKTPNGHHWSYGATDLDEVIRRAQAEARRRFHEEALRKAKARSKPREWKTVREFCDAALVYNKKNAKNWSYAKIAEMARAKFDGAKTSESSVAWYATQLRKAGKL